MKRTLIVATCLLLLLQWAKGQNCDPPEIMIIGIDSEVCINDDPYAIEFQPAGGLFRIGDVEMADHIFDPAQVGVGEHNLIYIYQFSPDCSPIIFSKSVMVKDLPEVGVNADTVISCSKDRVVLAANSSVGGSDFEWQSNGTTLINSAFLETMTPGLYTVFARTNSCTNFLNVNVVLDTMSPVVMAVDYDVIDCEKQTFQLVATTDVSNGNYAWSQPQGFFSEEASPTVEELGVYDLMFTNLSNGCTTDTIVEVKAPITDLDVVFDVPSCPEIPDGQIEVINVSGDSPPYVYTVNEAPFVMDSLFAGLVEGSYKVSAQDFYGCVVDTTISLTALDGFTVSLPTIDLAQFRDQILVEPTIVPVGENITDFRWTVNDSIACDNCSELNLLAEDNARIALEAINDKGCTASAQTSLIVDKTPKVFVPNVFSPNGDLKNDEFCLFANPVIRSIAKFTVFDRWGNLLYEQSNLPVDGTACWNGMLDGETVQTGTYIYILNLDLETGGNTDYGGSITVLK